jgi:UDP-N-acetylmuramoylalanine--D-glutamate ligase
LSAFEGKQIAVVGMGRSGITSALAANRQGAKVCVFDEHSADTESRMAEVEQLESEGIEVITGWHGRLQGIEFDHLITSPGFRRDHPALRDAVDMGRDVLSEVEFAYRIAKAPIIGITGTNGKSTVTAMTWHLAQAAGLNAVLCGNISGSGYREQTMTEAAESSPADAVLVAEISSYQLEWVSEFRPRVATVTNVTPDHFDRHPNFEDYFETKLRLFDRMGAGNTAVVNADEPSVPRSVVESRVQPGARVVTVQDIARFNAASGKIEFGTGSFNVKRLPVVGLHNVTNACLSLALVESFLGEISDERRKRMLESLASFRGLEHRMELIGSKSGISIVNNSMCTNPGAVIASSSALVEPHTLLMGGTLKGLDFAPVGDYLRNRSDVRVVLFSEFADDLAASLGIDAPKVESLDAAFCAAVDQAKAGESVVLAPGCASAYPYTNFRERGDAFRAMAKEWLES